MKIFNFLKKILFFIIKEFFSFFIKLFLLVIFILFLVSIILFKQKNILKTKNKIFIEINLRDQFLEQKTDNLDFLKENSLAFYELIDSIEKSKKDSRVEGIILNIEDISLNFAQIEELGNTLTKFKNDSKKPIYSYAENLNKFNFYISTFTNNLMMPNSNSTTVNIYPYFRENFYIKNFMDRLGIKFNIVNIGNYKTYKENLSHNSMTKQNREDKTRILQNEYQNFINIVSKNLNLDKIQFSNLIESGDLVSSSSIALYEKGLVDNLTSLDNFKSEIGEENIISIYEYNKNYISPNNKTKNKIYILTLEGEIGGSKENILDNITYIDVNKIIKELEKLKNAEDIKAIILRIDSPGGSALIADKISKKVKEVSKVKPIYTSMAGVCASGGYYIATNSNKIFTDKNTVTGSIGVISIIPEITQALEKLGIKNEKIIKGKYADLYSSTDFTEEKYEKIKNSNLKVYQDFLNVVSKSRNIKMEDLEKIAGGRIWTGEEAVKIKLADKIGGLKTTIENIASDNNLKNYTVVMSKNKFELKEIFKNYSNSVSLNKINILKMNIKGELYKEFLLNKPIMYFPYRDK